MYHQSRTNSETEIQHTEKGYLQHDFEVQIPRGLQGN